MTPLPSPPPQFLLTVTAEEARAASMFIAESLRPPVKVELLPHEHAAVAVFAKLSGILDQGEGPEDLG